MRPIIVFPLPFDAWAFYEQFVDRFTRSFKQFDPGHDYELWAVCNWGEPTDFVREMFFSIKTKFVPYQNHGCDIGSAQHVAIGCDPGALMICMTSRCYFHRAGWLAKYVEAYERHGEDSLYGASASFESGTPHICTRAYGIRAGLLYRYPHKIDTRPKGQKFEVGEWCLTNWCRKYGGGCWQVTWDGEQEQDGWRSPENIYRRGDQSNMLVWDKHTDNYQQADAEEKLRQETITGFI